MDTDVAYIGTPTFFGGDTQYSPLSFADYGAELGIFYLVNLICLGLLLNKVNGRPKRIYNYICTKQFDLFADRAQTPNCIKNYLSFMSWVYLVLPFSTIAIWSITLITDAATQGYSVAPAICLILVLVSALLLVLDVMKIKWNNWRFKNVNFTMQLCALALFTIFQCIVVLYISPGTNSEDRYLGISCLFEGLSGLVITMYMYFNWSSMTFNMRQIFRTHFEPGNEDLDATREEDFGEEVMKQKKDELYQPTLKDVLDIFTIGKISTAKMLQAFGGGFQSKFEAQSQGRKRCTNIFQLMVYAGLNAGYAAMIYYLNDYSKMGIVTAVCIMSSDLVIISLAKAKIIGRPSYFCFFAVLNRVFIIGGGRQNWAFGLVALYVVQSLILADKIGKKRFRFSEEVGAVDIEQLSTQKRLVDITVTPEFLLITQTLAILIGMGLIVAIQPRDVFLGDLVINNMTLSPFTTLIAAVAVVLIFTIYYLTYRAFMRKKRDLTPLVYYYASNKNVDTFQMCCILSVVVSCMWTLLLYWSSGNVEFFILGLFVPMIVLFFANTFLYYSKNDYRYLKSVKNMNTNVARHNKIIEQMRQKAKTIRREIRNGTSEILAPDQMGLAVSIIEKIKLERELQKAMKESRIQSTKVNKRNYRMRKQAEEDEVSRMSQSGIQKATPNAASVKASNIISESQDRKENVWDVQEGGEEEQNNLDNSESIPLSPFKNCNLTQKYNPDSDSELSDDFDLNANQVFLAEDIAKKARCKHKPVVDWRDNYGTCGAFWKGKLRRHDYKLFFNLLGTFVSIILLAGSINMNRDNLDGLIYATPFLHYILVTLALSSSIASDAPMTIGEKVILFLAYVLQYVISIGYLFYAYDSEDFDRQEDIVTPAQQSARNYMIWFIIVVPLVSASTGAFMKFLDQDEGLSQVFWGLAVCTVVHVILLITALFLFMPTESAVLILVLFILLGYGFFQYQLYKKNGYYFSKFWRLLNQFIVFLAIFAFLVYSLTEGSMSIFAGFTSTCVISMVICSLMLMVRIYSDNAQKEQQPVFYSPWLLPAYKFLIKKGKIVPHFQAIYLLLAFCIIGFFWALLVVFVVQPAWLGVCFMIFFESVAHFVILYLVNESSIDLSSVRDLCDDIIIKQAWLDAKEFHVVERVQAMNRRDLATYEDWWHRRFYLRNYMRLMEGKKLLQYPESKEFEFSQKELNESVNKKEFLQCKLEEFMGEDELDEIENMEWLYAFQYETDLDVKDAYEQELELCIQFQLTIVQLAKNLRRQERKYLFKFLEERRAELFVMGISINNPSQGRVRERYAKVVIQLQKLSNDQQTIFNALRDKYILTEREQAVKEQLAAELEDQKNEERQLLLADMSAAKREKLKNIDLNAPLDEIPDCGQKYEKIVDMCKSDSSYCYTDKEFDAQNQLVVLGDKVDKSLPQRGLRGLKFVRARDLNGAVLYSGGVSHRDVQQGALGDCYFLSAISVLGGPAVKDIILEQENEEWKKTGCFMLRFFKDGQPEVVIIDDYLPCNSQGVPAFCRGGPKGLELWPAILEKAYAKMYSNYSFIEAGKIQIALADMTDGFPEQMELRHYEKNLQLFWEKILSLYKKGALMGAGSPEHEMGDQAISEQGIVQGHAYAVLRVVQYDKQKLIQLRNPHGEASYTREWLGDWSDESESWDERAKRKLAYTPQESPDGIFWMSAIDFLHNFKYLYVCRILNERKGWYEKEFFGEWKGKSSAGFPGKFYNLPQYKVTVTKPCDGFISLRQHDKLTTFKGKNYIGWFCAKERGKKITKLKRENIIAKAGLSNLNVVTGECDFPRSVDYPYSFTLMVGSQKSGPQGEGKYDLSIYSTDPKMQVEVLK